ncbi:MAG: hypothetical protein FJZ00_04470 [Candidatus Sericytochromatia bacterium]|uniref:Uncharacterized protein n=1 Tax=Candidatus Tanganyikabacteria bacterium TaxID=2961651 RepID=A0A937X6A9_9BACT|nr:hypothetical protein [Candidatus Tanganyikabacteria bacterium]
MGKKFGGGALIAVALFMLVGFLRSGVDPWAPATVLALLVAVVLPAGFGVWLLAGTFGATGRIAARQEEVKLRTLQSEILKLAGRHGDKITAVEVAAELAVEPKAAEAALENMAVRELADVELADSGHLVYSFRRLADLPEAKANAKRVLDA